MKRNNINTILIAFLLCAALFLTSCSAAGKGTETISPEPTEVPAETATASDETAYDDSTEYGEVDYHYDFDDGDVMLNLTLDDLFDETENKFVFPGVPWGTEYSEIPGMLGVTELSNFPEENPELWATLDYGDGEILFIPYLTAYVGESSLMQYQLMIDEQNDPLLEGLTEQVDGIVAAFTDKFGEPSSNYVDEEQHRRGVMEVHEYRWNMPVESGYNSLLLIIGYYGDEVHMLDILVGNKS